MSDRTNNDLAALLTPAPSKGVQFSQGVILSWDNQFGTNQIEWRGITLTDIPFVEGVNPLTLKPGDVVGMLGWAPENAKGVGSWWILGKITNPGEFVSDLTFFLGQIRFMTKADRTITQAFFGSDPEGEPFTIFYYGDASNTIALSISDRTNLNIHDASGNSVFGTDGASLNGLSRPYLNIPMVASSGTSVVVGGPFWPAFTNAAYQEVFHCFTTLWHPRIAVGISESVTAGTIDWQLRLNGVTLGSASGSGNAIFDITGWGSTVTPGAILPVQLFARNTSGTQSRMIVNRCYGLQS
jgi:hypothetical protein